MATYFVGPGGVNTNAGTSWATRWLTLTKAAGVVAAGDTVYVGPGAYRELLTVAASGTLGSPITWIGDYLGTHTDGVGGAVRITGSDDDVSYSRTSAISANLKSYNTLQGFVLDSSFQVVNLTSCVAFVIDRCYFPTSGTNGNCVNCSGSGQSALTITNCFIRTGYNTIPILFTHSALIDNTGHLVQNCIVYPANGVAAIQTSKVGGITVQNCAIFGGSKGVYLGSAALDAGQTVTVRDCFFVGTQSAIQGTNLGDVVEDYNVFVGCQSDRLTVNTGTHSVDQIPCFDARWFFQLVFGNPGPNSNQVVSQYDLASYSTLLNLAQSGAPSADMRGTAAQGANRERGPLEYDSTLRLAGGGGPVVGSTIVMPVGGLEG